MEQQQQRKLAPHRIAFEIYAYDGQEAEECRQAIVAFIGEHARQGRAVTAAKVARAIERWDRNPIVKGQVIGYFT